MDSILDMATIRRNLIFLCSQLLLWYESVLIFIVLFVQQVTATSLLNWNIIIRWRSGQFFKAPKTMKKYVYVYNTALLCIRKILQVLYH